MGRKIKIENRNAILKAAYHLFIKRGYENVPTTEIAREAGLHNRVLFRYFRKKDDILTEIIARIEAEMVDYISGDFTDDSAFNFTAYFLTRVEFSLMYPDFFRLRASIVMASDAFMKMFVGVLVKVFELDENWKNSEEKRRTLYYLMGGTQMIQYEYLISFPRYNLPIEGMDFLTNYSNNEIPRMAAEEFRRYMEFAAKQNLRLLGCPDDEANGIIEKAKLVAAKADVKGFREYYEKDLDFLN